MAQAKSLSDKDRRIARDVIGVLKPFLAIRETMPLQYMRAFLLVAADEHHNVTQYAVMAGVSQSLMTRYLSDLGKVNRYHQEGFGLVEAYDDLMDRRNRLHRLTAKGQHVVFEMGQAINR